MAKKKVTSPKKKVASPGVKRKRAASPSGKNKGHQFTVDLRNTELTDEEVRSLGNEITRLAVQSVGAKGDVEAKREPYVEIIFVKSMPHGKSIRL